MIGCGEHSAIERGRCMLASSLGGGRRCPSVTYMRLHALYITDSRRNVRRPANNHVHVGITMSPARGNHVRFDLQANQPCANEQLSRYSVVCTGSTMRSSQRTKPSATRSVHCHWPAVDLSGLPRQPGSYQDGTAGYLDRSSSGFRLSSVTVEANAAKENDSTTMNN